MGAPSAVAGPQRFTWGGAFTERPEFSDARRGGYDW
jgi:hypothetical protein